MLNPYANTGADSFDPAVITLNDGVVNSIQTAQTDPRVSFDRTGLWAKDAGGGYTFQLDASTGQGFFKGGILVGSQVPASVITGQLTDAQLQAISAGKVTGQLLDAQIAALAAAKVTGQMTDSQLAGLAAAKLIGQVTDAQLAAIAAGKITGQLTNAQIAGMDAAKLAGLIATGQLADLAVTGQKIAASTITAANILAGTIVGSLIAGATITADKMAVNQLSSIAVDAGTITAGIFRGAIFETNAADPKVRFDATGFFVTDGTGAKVLKISSNGVDIIPDVNDPDSTVSNTLKAITWTDGVNDTGEHVGSAWISGVQNRRLMHRVWQQAAGEEVSASLQAERPGAAPHKEAGIRSRITSTNRALVEVFTADGAGISGSRILYDQAGGSDFVTYPSGWQPLPYSGTNFQDSVPPDQAGQYRVSTTGEVELRGVCQTKAGVTLAFNVTNIAVLPVGARPPSNVYFPIYVYDSNGITGTMAQLAILSTGVMQIVRDLTGRAQTRTSPYIVTLNGVRFSILP